MSTELDRDLLPIDALLRRAADAFPYPGTPPLAMRVRAAIAAPAPEQRRWSPGRFAFAPAFGAALAVVALLIGAALAIPGSRSALADLFDIGNVRVEREPAGSPTPPVLAPNNFARPSSIVNARGVVDFPILVPTIDGKAVEPDAVYIQGEEDALPVVISVYEDEGFDLYQTRLGTFGKGTGEEGVIETSFDGHNALWIEAGGHIAQFYDEQDRLVIESRRSVKRATLLWGENGITYRIETSLSLEDAIEVARSLH